VLLLLSSGCWRLIPPVPFPRLHFFTAGYAPLISSASRSFSVSCHFASCKDSIKLMKVLQASNVHDLTSAIFQKSSLLAAIDPSLGKYLTVSVAYRGKLSMRDSASCRQVEQGVWEADGEIVETAVYDFQNKASQPEIPGRIYAQC
jgi:tubulin beta